MTQNTTRAPIKPDRPGSPSLTPSAGADKVSARSSQIDFLAFLENAAGHLRDAGYFVEIDFDDGEVCIYVEGQEVHFVRTAASPAETQGPLKH